LAAPKSRGFSNKLLSALPDDVRDDFVSDLTKVDLPRRTPLETRKKRIDYVYFLEGGIASIVATNDMQVEVGIIGYEGVTGLSILHMSERAIYSAYMQVGGFGWRASASALRRLMDENAQSRRVFLAFAQAFLVQTAETAVANARASVGERLARWILMAQDRVRSDEIPLTHEFLALMMAARRPGVTEAMHELERRGLVVGERGRVIVRDRTGLIERAGSYYGVPETEFGRLLRV
jgi:CRP-like cAMP-binding protein